MGTRIVFPLRRLPHLTRDEFQAYWFDVHGLVLAPEIEPKAKPAGGMEISFVEPDQAALHATHSSWQALGLTIPETLYCR